MLKQLVVSVIVLEFFTACGAGGGSNSTPNPRQQMSGKQGVIIFYHYIRWF